MDEQEKPCFAGIQTNSECSLIRDFMAGITARTFQAQQQKEEGVQGQWPRREDDAWKPRNVLEIFTWGPHVHDPGVRPTRPPPKTLGKFAGAKQV